MSVPRLVRSGILGLAGIVLASILLGGGAAIAAAAYGAFNGGQAAVDARGWASHPLVYRSGACQACHAAQVTAAAAGGHTTVRCEVCHGPLGGHPGAEPSGRASPGASPAVALTSATSSICVTCHARIPGRPASLPQVDPATHYSGSGGVCLRCHDPHTIRAVAPPDVLHPLAGLPACTTCHRPDGLKKIPAGHELVADRVCLSCHAVAKAGP